MRPSTHTTIRKVKGVLARLYTTLLFFLDSVIDLAKLKPSLSLISYQGDLISQSFPRVAVFAVYINSDAEFYEAKRVINLLNKEFDFMILVNTGSYRITIDQPKLLHIHRKNFGRDLASYKYGLDLLNLENTSELLFFNDSVLWTKNSLSIFLTNARKSVFQVTSLTSSDQDTFHLQSYALHLKGDVAQHSKAFSEIKLSHFKRILVEAGEKRLSNYWVSNQIRIGGLFSQLSLGDSLPEFSELYPGDYDQLQTLLSRGIQLNPSIHLWAPLYKESGVIKKALIAANPTKFKYVPKSLGEVQSKIILDPKLFK